VCKGDFIELWRRQSERQHVDSDTTMPKRYLDRRCTHPYQQSRRVGGDSGGEEGISRLHLYL
jgi:hypothetical protein